MEEGVSAVILAAGFSKRTKKDYKLTLKFQDKTLIEKCVSPFLKVCDKVIVVTGHKRLVIEDIFKTYSKVETHFNENFEKGMFTSVKCGISKLNCKRLFITPGDYPLYSVNLLQTMLNTKGEVVIPTFNKRKGHPVLIDGKYIENILSFPDNSSLRDFINSVNTTYLEVDENSILQDVDTLKDYEKVLKDYEQ